MAQVETPCPDNLRSEPMSSQRADAPVAMMSDSVVMAGPSASAIVNGRRVRSTLVTLPPRSLGAEAQRLLPHLDHQVRPHDPVPEPGPVLHHRRQHQLAACLEPLDQERLQVGAGGVQRGGQPGRARPDDDDLPISHRIRGASR